MAIGTEPVTGRIINLGAPPIPRHPLDKLVGWEDDEVPMTAQPNTIIREIRNVLTDTGHANVSFTLMGVSIGSRGCPVAVWHEDRLVIEITNRAIAWKIWLLLSQVLPEIPRGCNYAFIDLGNKEVALLRKAEEEAVSWCIPPQD